MEQQAPRARSIVGPVLPFAAVVMVALAAVPADASSLWGYSGLALIPSPEVLHPGEYAAGARLGVFQSEVLYPAFVSAGLVDGLEVHLLFPGRWNNPAMLSGGFTYQLVRATRENPTRVAVGLSNLGMPAVVVPSSNTPSFVAGNNVFMVLARDFNASIGGQLRTLAIGHFGFTGSALSAPFLNLDSRVMLGLEVPFLDYGSCYGEYLGPSASSGTSGQFFNLGLRYAPLSGLEIDVMTMGQPGLTPLERAFLAGIAYRGRWPAIAQMAAKLGATLKIASSSPPVSPVPPPNPEKLPPPPGLAPPPAPQGTVYGRVTTAGGAPLPDLQVGLLEEGQWHHPTQLGSFYLDVVPGGRYTLAAEDASGHLVASRSIEVSGEGPVEANLQVMGR